MTLDELIDETCAPADIKNLSIWAPMTEPGLLYFTDKSSRTYKVRVGDGHADAKHLAIELIAHVELVQKLLGS